MATSRDSYFDNAKFLLIFLVVFGHIIRSYIHDNDALLHIYKFIYTFHMPAFILISGYFAKGFNRPGYVKKSPGADCSLFDFPGNLYAVLFLYR